MHGSFVSSLLILVPYILGLESGDVVTVPDPFYFYGRGRSLDSWRSRKWVASREKSGPGTLVSPVGGHFDRDDPYLSRPGDSMDTGTH